MSSADGFRLGARAARMLARTRRFPIAPGLTDDEVTSAEREFGFEFADDHRAFLQAGLPMDDPDEVRPREDSLWPFRRWPNWRDGDPGELRRVLTWQVEGVLFDVAHNGLWPADWGPRPAGAQEALSAARAHLAKVPQMVPLYVHRYLPAGRGTQGHPVLLMWQTDIIIYAANIADYIDREFGGAADHSAVDPSEISGNLVPFWSDFAGKFRGPWTLGIPELSSRPGLPLQN